MRAVGPLRAAALLALLSVALAQPTALKVAFTKGALPAGYARYTPSALNKGSTFVQTSITSVAPPFRAFVKSTNAIVYTVKLQPGTYVVRLGFAELNKYGCRAGTRTFKVTVNNKKTPSLDAFALAGKCQTAHIYTVPGVVVKANGVFKLTVKKDAGKWPAFLSTLEAELTSAGGGAGSSSSGGGSSSSSSGGASSSSGGGKSVLFLDVGGSTDQPSVIRGATKVYSGSQPVAGTSQDKTYSRHRYGQDFTYVVNVKKNAKYTVAFLVAEMYKPACKKGFRLFDVFAHDGKKKSSFGEKLFNIDVFDRAGCQTAYRFTLPPISVGSSGEIAIRFRAKKNNAMISAIDILSADGSSGGGSSGGGGSSPATPEPTVAPTPVPPSSGTEVINIDVGGKTDVASAVKGTSKVFTPTFPIAGTSQDDTFSRHRYGSDFTYVLTVAKGATYTVEVLLAESYLPGCKKGFRVFDITAYDNAKSQGSGKTKSNLDVFAVAGCRAAYRQIISGVAVGNSGKLAIRFKAKKNNAMVSGIVVKSTGGGPVVLPPAPTSSPDVLPPSPMPSTPPPASGIQVIKVDSAGPTDIAGSLSGTSKSFKNSFPISKTVEDDLFSMHRYGKSFSYEVSVQAGITYSVNLFFAESYKPGCVDAFRLFDVTVYDSDAGEAKGQKSEDVDVFKLAGCRAAYTLPINGLKVGKSGQIIIKLVAKKNNAMISGFEILTTDPKYSGKPTPTPSVPATIDPTKAPPTPLPTGVPTTDKVVINVGAKNDRNVAGTKKVFTSKFVSGTKSASSAVYKNARVGKNFEYTFNLSPGAYDIFLGFAEFENANCVEPANRVFNVLINDEVQLEGFDIYDTAGCFKGVEEKFTQSVSAVLTKPLVIRFESVIGLATLSYISIQPAAAQCVPESTTGELSADHAAHSVPGSYPPQVNNNSPKSYVDSDGDGFVTVKIDGSSSHTHFFDSKNKIVGRLTKYTWTLVDTGEVISNKVSFFYKFPLGTTRLRLAVIDNSCTTDEAETTVTVTGAVQPGQFCYYYSGLTEAPIGGTLLDDPRPQFAVVSKTLDLGFPKFSFSGTAFAARCFFFLEVDEDSESTIKINTFGTGDARVYKGEDLIIDTQASNTGDTELPVGLTGFEVTYFRTNNKAPRLQFLVDGKVPPLAKVSHDRKTIVPILTSVTPNEGPLKGGTQVKVNGYAMFQPLKVTVDGKSVKVLPFGVTPNQFFFKTPSTTKAGVAEIVATTGSKLPSNPINFAYGSTCDSIDFKFTEMTTSAGGEVDDLQLPTCAFMGHDQKLYLGTLGGSVQVIEYNRVSLKTISRCYSKNIIDNSFKTKGKPSVRDVLGITADPRDKVIRPYVSTSTLFAQSRGRIDASNKAAWRNAAVDRLKPGTDKSDKNVCLVYDKRIVSGLPVSNHDHGVNALMFTQNGDLLIAVGGNTNMGLPGYKLGGLWETPLSGAVLIAKLSKKGFNGNIKYSNADVHYLAKKTSGDVDVFASGLRNCFTMAMNTVGEMFATDQSSNCGFGNAASACNDFTEAAAKAWDYSAKKDWPGQKDIKGSLCGRSVGRPDKVVQLEAGKFYGHANHARDECAWIDPFTQKTIDGKAAPANYKKPIVTLKSPATGLDQYQGNHFCGKLRGEMISSAYKGGNTFRLRVNKGKKVSGPDQLLNTGGITFAENAHGELLFPRLNLKKMFIMQPKVSLQAGLYISGLLPFRHGKNGGTPITIGGFNFGVAPKVTIGSKTCATIRSSDTEITCTVPSNSGGPKSLTVTTSTGEKQTLGNAVLYMNV